MGEGNEEQLSKNDRVLSPKGEEQVRRVKLRGAVFGYFANRMISAYNAERDRRQREEGTIVALEEFYKNRYGTLMSMFVDKFEGKSEFPESVELDLHKGDLDLILEKTREPSNYQDRLIYRMHKDDLVRGFKNSKEVKLS